MQLKLGVKILGRETGNVKRQSSNVNGQWWMMNG